MATTPGFSAKSLAFLRALEKNNDRVWFHERRAEYEQHLRAPMVAIVEQLSKDFGGFAPELVADPRLSLFRPWRDTRFSEDKSPLKTNIAAVFPHRDLGRMRGAALYFEVTPTWVWIGGGIYAPDSGQLLAIREHIAEHHARLRRIVSTPALRAIGRLKGETLSRVPRGFAADHPAADLLKHKQWLGAREEPAAFAVQPDFYRQLVATMKTLMPLNRFINEPLLEKQRQRGPR